MPSATKNTPAHTLQIAKTLGVSPKLYHFEVHDWDDEDEDYTEALFGGGYGYLHADSASDAVARITTVLEAAHEHGDLSPGTLKITLTGYRPSPADPTILIERTQSVDALVTVGDAVTTATLETYDLLPEPNTDDDE